MFDEEEDEREGIVNRMMRPMSLTDYYLYLDTVAGDVEAEAFEHLGRKFGMSDFEVKLVDEPSPYGMSEVAGAEVLFYVLPDDLQDESCDVNSTHVPVIVSKSDKVSVKLENFLTMMGAKNVETGEMLWTRTVNSMITNIGAKVHEQLETCFGENYFDREGSMFIFGGVVFNYVITLTHVHMQLICTHGLQCPDRSKFGSDMLKKIESMKGDDA